MQWLSFFSLLPSGGLSVETFSPYFSCQKKPKFNCKGFGYMTFLYLCGSWQNKTSWLSSCSCTVELNIMSTLLLLLLPCTVPLLWLLIVFTSTIPGEMIFFFLCHERKILSLSRAMEKDDSLSSSAAGSIDLWMAFTLAGSGHYGGRNKPAIGFFSPSRFSMDSNKVLPVVLDATWVCRKALRKSKVCFFLQHCVTVKLLLSYNKSN